MWLFLVLLAVPMVEIALFIQVGGAIGLWPTLGLVILTAFLGAVLLRAQGVAAMARLQASLAEGGDPRGPLAHGAMILAAGFLMLTPGFFTDVVGFLLLLPPFRTGVIGWAGPRLAAQAAARAGRTASASRRPAPPQDIEIDDYIDVTEEPSRPPSETSGWSRPPKDD